MEYIIYCDEGSDKGDKFDKFYGGALVRSTDFDEIYNRLKDYKRANNLTGEMKWQKVTPQKLELYKGFMDEFFHYVKQDKIKVRIMFQQKSVSTPKLIHLSKQQKGDGYFLLYYQFIKHAFGLCYANETSDLISLKLYFDQFPDTKEKAKRFKYYIHDLQKDRSFCDTNIEIKFEDITEVVSHNHDILQCVDIITGAMWYRLNELHLAIPQGEKRRGKRTVAKDKLYKHIYGHISEIRKNFNIGVSTGKDYDTTNRWNHSYRHWLFVPNQTFKMFALDEYSPVE